VKTRGYQIAFAISVTGCVVLALALAYLVKDRIRPTHPVPQGDTQDPVVARGPEREPAANSAPANTDPELAPLQLSPQRLQQIGVTTAEVAFRNVTDKLSVPGNVEIDEQLVSYVQTRYAGWIQNVTANATYQYVRKGQRLFTVYSPDLVSSEQELLLAKQSQQAFAHDAHGMAMQDEGWMLQAAEERLRRFGVSQEDIAAVERSGKPQHELAVESPVSGYITERNALPNAYVQPDTKLYTIADLSTVWVYANIFQTDVGRLRPGDTGQVTVDAYPGRTFYGRIDQILPQVDSTTRTVRVRFAFQNPGVVLKPGMYVNVAIAVALGRQMVVPSSAVLQAGTRAIAFVDHGQGNLEPRTIQMGPQVDDSIVVLSGLKPGEKVVSSANFLVDSEAQLHAALGSFASAAQQQSPGSNVAAAAQIQIDFSSQPSPLHSGANTLIVKLADADGNPVTGAQASAIFFMPAMPAMGMAAQRALVTLTEKGSGMYEGPLKLSYGGDYQVTVTVQRNGQTIATKQMTVNVAGGM
jgi:RND family efflux transporter MFP subunit